MLQQIELAPSGRRFHLSIPITCCEACGSSQGPRRRHVDVEILSLRFWHPLRGARSRTRFPGGRSPFAPSDHRLPSGNAAGWPRPVSSTETVQTPVAGGTPTLLCEKVLGTRDEHEAAVPRPMSRSATGDLSILLPFCSTQSLSASGLTRMFSVASTPSPALKACQNGTISVPSWHSARKPPGYSKRARQFPIDHLAYLRRTSTDPLAST